MISHSVFIHGVHVIFSMFAGPQKNALLLSEYSSFVSNLFAIGFRVQYRQINYKLKICFVVVVTTLIISRYR